MLRSAMRSGPRKMRLRRPVSAQFSAGGEVEATRTADPHPLASAWECAPKFALSIPQSSILNTSQNPRRYRQYMSELLQKPKKLYLYKESNPKELARFLDEGIDIDSPDCEVLQGGVGYLLHLAIAAGRMEYLEATLALISRSNVQLNEEHYSVILLGMDRYGWHSTVKSNLKQMAKYGLECKLETLFSLVTASLQRKDFQFAVEVVEMLVRNVKYRRPPVLFPIMEKIVEGCMGAGEEEGVRLVNLVLKWYGVANVTLDRRIVQAIVRWIQSLEKECQIVTTRVLPTGCCEACGAKLVTSTSPAQASHAALLKAIGSLIVTQEERHPVSVFPSLRAFLNEHKFGAILDGMNVACCLHDKFDSQSLIGVAKKMEKVTGLPSLVILREHCKILLSLQSCSDYDEFVEMCKPTKFFFVHDFFDDDFYTMYAALASGPDTFFVSRDQLADKMEMLHPRGLRGLFQKWRRKQQVHLERKEGELSVVFQERSKLSVQWEMNQQLHLPYTQNECICIKFDQ